MKKMYFIIIVLLISGCNSKPVKNHVYKSQFYEPSTQEKANADYGKYPNDFENIIKNHMRTVLKDPESARYRFDGKISKSHTIAKSREKMKYCWHMSYWVNSKNSYGGYTGDKLGLACIRNGKIVTSRLLN